MRTNRIFVVFVLLMLSIHLYGCKEEQKPESSVSPLTEPKPFDSSVSTLPAASPLDVPTPLPGQAVIVGRIVASPTDRAPAESVIYLGQVLSMDNGKPVVRLNERSDVFAIPDASGRFVFPDVPPGEYGLILHTPDFSFLVEDVGTEDSSLFTVGPGDVLDFGKLEVILP